MRKRLALRSHFPISPPYSFRLSSSYLFQIGTLEAQVAQLTGSKTDLETQLAGLKEAIEQDKNGKCQLPH